MREIRIFNIIPYKILPARLGGEKGIALFNEYLGKIVSVTSISIKNNDTGAAKNFEVLNLLSNSRIRYANLFLFFLVRKLIKKKDCTHLMIEHPYYGWLAWLIKMSAKVTWIVHSHNIEFQRSRSIGRWWWPALKWYERWVYRKADLVFFISGDDRYTAISELGIDEKKSFVITYGVEISEPPSDNQECRTFICDKHGIDSGDVIMLFNGALYHHSNYEPVQIITEIINPLLLSHKSLRYKIIICGKGLPESFDELKSYRDKNIIYAGFVDDISIYFKAADIFLNPIVTGAGVKTKAIEAIAYNCTVVSTELGALGLNRDACGEKLHVVSNNDWKAFAGKVIEQSTQNARTGSSFYQHYYWGNIAQKVVKILNEKAPV